MVVKSCRIRELLKMRCMTQKELSEKSGLTEDQISRIASGERIGTVMTAIRLMKALNCDIYDIWEVEQ